jgi:hypothetical protein
MRQALADHFAKVYKSNRPLQRNGKASVASDLTSQLISKYYH